MKKHYLTLTRLLMVMLMAVGFSTAGQAAESRGDSIYNTASTDLQSVIRDINNLSLQYQNVTSIRNFLDEMASQGTATLKNTNSKWQIKKDSLQTMLSDLYDKQFEIRTEYEKKLNQLWADKDYEGYKKAQAEYEQQLKNYENKEKELRDQYDEGVKNWPIYWFRKQKSCNNNWNRAPTTWRPPCKYTRSATKPPCCSTKLPMHNASRRPEKRSTQLSTNRAV